MNRTFMLLMLTFLFVILSTRLIASKTDTSMLNTAPSPTEQSKDFSDVITNSQYTFQFRLSIIVISLGAVSLFIEAYLAKSKIIQSEHVFKCIILTLIITGSLLLITAGYSNSQINGITGLLGSIAGYLLAKTNFKNKPTPNRDDSDKN